LSTVENVALAGEGRKGEGDERLPMRPAFISHVISTPYGARISSVATVNLRRKLGEQMVKITYDFCVNALGIDH
jgi:hypothetical protein